MLYSPKSIILFAILLVFTILLTAHSAPVRREIVFLDPSIEGGERLVTGLDSRVEVVHLEPHRDGLEHIAATLVKRQQIDAIHLISHGAPAHLQLGAAHLTLDSMATTYIDELSVIRQALSQEANVFIYGCNFGQGQLGREAVAKLAALTGADIAASDDLTRAEGRGGDWDLEVQTGPIETAIVADAQIRSRYAGVFDITTGLVGHYKLDEGSGTTATDASVNSNDGTHLGSPTPVHATGVIKGGLTFSGNFDRVEITDPVDGSHDFDTNDFSVSFWFKSNAIPGSQARLAGKLFSAGHPGFVFFADSSGDVNFLVDDGDTDGFVSASGLLDGNWHHIVWVRDGNRYDLYADGLLVDFDTEPLLSISNSENLKFGASDASSGDYDGSLDDIRLYDRGLTASDVDELFATGQPLVVDTTNDKDDGDTSSISALLASKGADGFISLREAITAANNTAGTDTISFNITAPLAGGAHTIQVGNPGDGGLGALPGITDPVIIDGATEPDYMATPVIELDGSLAGSVIGLYLANGSDSSTIRALAINRFSGDGMEVANGADGITVVGNFIGTDVTGTMTGFGNGGVGIFITSDLNVIGGAGTDQNLISGNASDGININNGSQNTIAGNWIGIDVTGASALGNGDDGIQLSSADTNFIGDAASGLGNVISANGGYGVQVVGGSASDNAITSNLIGLNAAGTGALTNADDGIRISSAPDTTIGGSTDNARNVIAAPSGRAGIDLTGSAATGTVIQGNYIGTDINGTTRLTAGSFGISVFDVANTTIGGTDSGAGNVVAGYSVTGLHLSSNMSGSTVQGNFIGTDTSGALDLTTGFYGIGLQNSISNVTIGGTASDAGNVIAYHSQNGIKIWPTAGTGLAIQQNQIYGNGQLGIELDATGVTDNDTGDGDSGPNNLQNFPVLTSAATNGSRIAVRGSLNSTAATTFRLEFFANATADISGHGEGERYLGFVDVTTDAGTGDATFLRIFSAAVAAGEFITATATDPSQSTSEFALNVTAVADADSDSDGVLDSVEDRNLDGDDDPTTGPAPNTDGLGDPDYLDPDDDGDGMSTASEDANANGDPTDDDTDGDGIPDYLDPDDGGPGPGDSDGDMVDDDVECPSGPPCTDTDGDGIPNYNDPDHNTLVQNVTIQAQVGAQGVCLQWQTSFEVDNAGFHVHRKVDGEWVQVTPSLIAGSAFMAGPGTVLPAGHSYAWCDAAGLASDRYLLEDVDLQGQRTWHGPVIPQPMTPGMSPAASSTLLAHLGQRRQDKVQLRGRRPRIVPPQTDIPVVRAPHEPPAWEEEGLALAERQLALAATPAVIVTINERGWYRVSQNDLVRAGFDPDIDPRHLRLFAQGVEQVLHIQSDSDNRLAPGDTLEFYAKGLDTPWTDAQCYWLVAGTKPGLRVPQIESDPQPRPRQKAFPFTVTHRERNVYSAAVRNGLAENFFGAVIRDQPLAQRLRLRHLAPASDASAHLSIALQSVSSEPHDIQIDLNGDDVGTMTVGARAHHTATFAVPQAWLKRGVNIVTLHPLQPDATLSLVDHIQLTYRRTYTAHHDQLYSTVMAPQRVRFNGFTEAIIRVFDITASDAVTELLGPITRQGDRYRINVAPTALGERTLLAITDTQILKPMALEAHAPMRFMRRGANMVIITHRRFMDSVSRLQAHREGQGWSVALIDAQDLYPD